MKKVLVITAIAVGGLLYAGRQKVVSVIDHIKKLRVKVNSIKGLKLSSAAVDFYTTISITNPTPQNLTVNTNGVLTLRRLIFKNVEGVIIGESYPNTSQLEILANQITIVENIPTSIPLTKIGVALSSILPVLSDPQNLIIETEIETPAGIFLLK